MSSSVPADTSERVAQLERRQNKTEDIVFHPDHGNHVLAANDEHLGGLLGDLITEVRGLRRVIVGAAVSLALTGVVFVYYTPGG